MNTKLIVLYYSICFCLIASTFTVGAPVKAAETGNSYYVSTDGNDSNSGSIEKPWASLKFAAESLSPGDTLYLRGGTYISNQLTISKSGTIELPITIKGYCDGISPPEQPIIDMENNGHPSVDYTGTGIYFNDGTSNIILEGIKVVRTRGSLRAIELLPYPMPTNYDVHRNVIIRNCIIDDGSFGIGVGCSSGITIESCSLDNIGGNLMYIAGVQDGQGDGDAVAILNSEKVIVKDCYFGKAGHYSLSTGIWTRDVNGTPLPCKDLVIRNNLIENHWGGGIGLAGTFTSVAEDNIVKYIGEALINYPKAGIMICSEDSVVRRNVFMKAASVMYDPGIYMGTFATATCYNNRIYNNLMYKNGREGIRFCQRDLNEVRNNKLLNNVMFRNRAAGSEKMSWLPGTLKNEDMWYNIQIEAMTVQGTVAWTTGNANNNEFYNNDFLPYAENKDLPGYDRFIWNGLKTTDKFYSMESASTKFPTAFYDNIEANPKFVNEGETDDKLCDFNLQADSPCIDSGAHFTTTSQDGSDTSKLYVMDSRFFTDGCGLMPADKVKIGDREPVTITEINYASNTITLESPVTYAAGENVDLPYNGTAPDMGVHESPYSITGTEEPTATAIPTATTTSTPVPTSTPNNEFVDVNNATISWAADQIKELATAGIIKGYNEDCQWLFKPNNNITRAEYATLLTKAFILLDATAVSNFTDVVPGDWEYAYVAAASKLGIVKGISETEFAPDCNITRQDMATMMYRIYRNVLGASAIGSDKIDEALSIFSDQAKIDGYAREGVATMSHDGIIKGIGEGVDKCFAPLDNSTRAESAVVISRVLNKE